tara:strand:- start:559 stop:726 length:168 start_codon:yes stop_codon:yes gene_type:complete
MLSPVIDLPAIDLAATCPTGYLAREFRTGELQAKAAEEADCHRGKHGWEKSKSEN